MESISDNAISPVQPLQTQATSAIGEDGAPHTPFGSPRDFLDNRFVYLVISSRARGLSVGVNLCPDKNCNFNCSYCEVSHDHNDSRPLNVNVMAEELNRTLHFILNGRLRERPWYRPLPDELLQLRHVALSGDGEPTLSEKFSEALQAIVHLRAMGGFPFFKLVLLTNGTGLDRVEVQKGLKYFTRSDEIWVKLDGGTQAYLNRLAGVDVPLQKILSNIVVLGRQRPVVIQSLFPAVNEEGPPTEEIEEYARRVLELKEAGAQISLVQIYSATRPSPRSGSSHLPLKELSRIARLVRRRTKLNTEVF